MRIFPRPAASAADSERMLTRAAASALLMPARTPGFDWSDRTSWVVLGIVRLLRCFSELHTSRLLRQRVSVTKSVDTSAPVASPQKTPHGARQHAAGAVRPAPP